MTLAPAEAAGLITREVRNGVRGGAPTKIAVARRTYPTDRADLWDAVTNPERIPRWFLPVTGDLRVGGRYQLEGNAGGTVERCDAPSSFTATWEMGPGVSWLTVTLTPAPDGTTFELAHEAPVDPGFWAEYGPGAVGVGWDLGLLGLGLHVESGEAVDPEEGLAYATTPEGRGYIARSSQGWAQAAVAAGDAPDAARAAAANAFTFFTGAPADDAPHDA
jgi:uncharacterized protein YndB with AHSA1/START domain